MDRVVRVTVNLQPTATPRRNFGVLLLVTAEDVIDQAERLRSVERAITKATVQCYAVEGAYPASLKYLERNYGLILDHEKYIIQYDVFASNIMPTILVLPVGFEESDVGGFESEDWF